MHLRLLQFLATLLLLGLSAGKVAYAEPLLYAESEDGIDGYRLVNGFAGKPIVSYTVTRNRVCVNAPFALGPFGSVYVVTCDNGYFPVGVTEFAAGTNHVIRRIRLPRKPNSIFGPGAIAVDNGGRIYLSYQYNEISAGPTKRRHVRIPYSGTLVYSSVASGHVSPRLVLNAYGAVGAFDASGRLYLASYSAVQIWANPSTAPLLVATIQAPENCSILGLAISTTGELYLSCSTSAGSFIVVYPAGINGVGVPAGLFVPPALGFQIGVVGTTVYTARSDGEGGVMRFDSSQETRAFQQVIRWPLRPSYTSVLVHA